MCVISFFFQNPGDRITLSGKAKTKIIISFSLGHRDKYFHNLIGLSAGGWVGLADGWADSQPASQSAVHVAGSWQSVSH